MKQLNEALFQIKIPLPFPLSSICAYALKGIDGWTIIDSGLHSQETEEIWINFLDQQNSTWSDIGKIILTHYHPDHYGAAGWLQQKSGAPVYMSKTDYQAANLFWHHDYDMGITMQNFYLLHGMPNDLAEKMIFHLNEFLPWVHPKPRVTYLEDGDYIKLGNDDYLVIATPGHSDGHICFYQREKKILFSGDHILPKITPNISLWPEETDRNPLKSFIASLEKIKKYEIEITYPAHKTIISDVYTRIKEILIHHQERLDLVIEWIGNGATGYQVCEKMFGNNLSVHQLRFAMAESLAHLAYLEGEKRLTSKQIGNHIYWYPF